MANYRSGKPSRAEIKRTLELYATGKVTPPKRIPKKSGSGMSEAYLHKSVVAYIKTHWPEVRVYSTLDGERLAGDFQAARLSTLKSHRGIPDLLIFKRSGEYCGMAIEFKKPGYSPYKQDGALKAGQHLEEQQSYIDYLRKEGWRAGFGNDLNAIKAKIRQYLGEPTYNK